MKEVGSWVGKRGYRSKAEFAKESIRLRLEQQREHENMLRRLTKK
jgi:Arc/MetJ-type ribon-helix-helix transcriptional regulator